jgi:hypothetical protein
VGNLPHTEQSCFDFCSLAINEWAEQWPNESTQSGHPSKAFFGVLLLKADFPNVSNILPLAVLGTTAEMNVVANLVKQNVADLALA